MNDIPKEVLEYVVDGLGYEKNWALENWYDLYKGCYDNIADFVETILEEHNMRSEIPSWLIIDCQATWDCNLKHDFTEYEADDGKTYIFRNI
jgi:hypothetical protein